MEKSVKTFLMVAFIVGMLMFFLTQDWRDYFHTWTLILAAAGFVPIFMILASIYLVKKMYKNQIEEDKPRVKNTYDLDHLQSLPPYERAKKKLELLGLTKDKRYVLTPEESDALLQKARERRMAEEMSLRPSSNISPTASNSSPITHHTSLDIDDLEKYLREKIVGQDDAIKMLTDAIYQQAKVSSTRHSSPVTRHFGSYLFVGQTGVGKTETAKALAEYLKDYGYSFYRFDMNSFTQEHTASTLLGAPKGYIGSDEGGLLPRKLLENPRAVILFDEIEKAHPSLYRIFMTLIDEGYVQEVSTGMRVSVKDAIIIFTSNLYQETISNIASSVKDEVEKEMMILDVLTGKIPPLPTDYLYTDSYGMPFRFPAEFVARLTKVVPFRKLGYQDLEKIAMKIVGDRDKAVRLTRQLYPLAEKYGVRVFVKYVRRET
jgi:ATPases with chaperone activity, ATP-binding subunit